MAKKAKEAATENAEGKRFAAATGDLESIRRRILEVAKESTGKRNKAQSLLLQAAQKLTLAQAQIESEFIAEHPQTYLDTLGAAAAAKTEGGNGGA